MINESQDILFRAAFLWKKMTEYAYIITYGCRGNLYPITLRFTPENFWHLAGFQYLTDLPLVRANGPRSILSKILSRVITTSQISKGVEYERGVKPRLEALLNIKDALESDFTLYTYMPQNYPFFTVLKANYLIAAELETVNFFFIVKSQNDDDNCSTYHCCSAFVQGTRDYTFSQRRMTILKKEWIHLPSQTNIIVYDRLSRS